MNAIQTLLTEHIDIWTAADTGPKSGRGRRSANAASVYGIRKLRELILELAVRGKLVPQESNDEPASELLKRIQAEKAKLIAEGKIRKGQPLSLITEQEIPFSLPHGWSWVRLGQIGDWGAGATPLRSVSSYYGGSTPWFKSGELTADFIDTSEETITDLALKECSLRLNQPGDVLIAMYGATIGKTAILKIPGTTNQAVCACTPCTGIFNRYLLVLLKAMKSNFIGQGAGGAQPNISREKIIATIVAMPSTEEQHRIVAKVDELMALCDQLETQHNNATEAHEKLVNHLLGTLTQSQSAADFSANWQRIAAHFDTLFTTEFSIETLKQTLLQLAVMGKLVPQDQKDEPASELLKRIQTEKAKLIAEGKIKQDKPVPQIAKVEQPFDLPKGWDWVRLADLLALVTDGDHQAPPKAETGVPFLVIGNLNTGNVSLEDCRFVPEEYYKKLDWGKKPIKYDLLYTVTGSYGIPIIVDITERFCVQRHVAILKIVPSTPVNYLSFLLQSKYAMQYATEIATGIAQKTVPLTGLRIMPIATPPVAEQQRIVAKVDELMALCDQLQSRITDSNQLQQKLADVLVEQVI